MTALFSSLGLPTISKLLISEKESDVEMAIYVLKTSLSEKPIICTDLIKDPNLMRCLIKISITRGINIRIVRTASCIVACFTSFAIRLPLSAQTIEEKEKAIEGLIKQNIVSIICDRFELLDKPDHIVDTSLLVIIATLSQVSKETRNLISERGTFLRILIQIACEENDWKNLSIQIPSYYDDRYYVRDMALNIIEVCCNEKKTCDRISECNGARSLLSIILPGVFNSQPSSSVRKSVVIDRKSLQQTNNDNIIKKEKVEETNSKKDVIQISPLVTREATARVLICCINNSSEFARQFFRISLALTAASPPSAPAVERFFPLLYSGTPSSNISITPSSSLSSYSIHNVKKVETDDHFALQRLCLMVIRRALIGTSRRSSILSLGTQPNSRSNSRPTSSKSSKASTTSSSSSAPKPPVSNRVSRRRASMAVSTSASTATGAMVTNHVVAAKANENSQSNLSRQTALSICSHGLLSVLTWCLISSHPMIKDYAAQLLESISAPPKVIVAPASITSSISSTPTGRSGGGSGGASFRAVSAHQSAQTSATLTAAANAVALSSAQESESTRKTNMKGGKETKEAEIIEENSLIPLLEQGCVPVLIMILVLLRSNNVDENKNEVEIVDKAEELTHPGHAGSVRNRRSFSSSTQEVSDECIALVAEQILSRISVLVCTEKPTNIDTDLDDKQDRVNGEGGGSLPSSRIQGRSLSNEVHSKMINSIGSSPSHSEHNSRRNSTVVNNDIQVNYSINSFRTNLNNLVITVGSLELRTNVAIGLFLLSRLSKHQFSSSSQNNECSPKTSLSAAAVFALSGPSSPSPSNNKNSSPRSKVIHSSSSSSASSSSSISLHIHQKNEIYAKERDLFLPQFILDYKVVDTIASMMKNRKTMRSGILILKCIDLLLLSPFEASKQKKTMEQSQHHYRLQSNNHQIYQNSLKYKAWLRYELECEQISLYDFLDLHRSNSDTNGGDDGDDDEDEQITLIAKNNIWLKYLDRKKISQIKDEAEVANEDDEDIIVLICEEDGATKMSGVKMNCPCFDMISKVSPFLATVLLSSSNHFESFIMKKKQQFKNNKFSKGTKKQKFEKIKRNDDDDDEQNEEDDDDLSKLPKLFGSYEVWEEIMSHIASKGRTFREHSHMFSLETLFSLLSLSIKYHITALSTLYTKAIINSHLDNKSAPFILNGAIKVKAFSLANHSFRNLLLSIEEKMIHSSSYEPHSDVWFNKAAIAIGKFLHSVLNDTEGIPNSTTI